MSDTSRQGWQEDILFDFSKGVSVERRPETIDKEQFPKAENVILYEGSIRSDTGYRKFGRSLLGNPRATYQLFKKDGSEFTVCLTNRFLYEWDGGIDVWDGVTFNGDNSGRIVGDWSAVGDGSISTTLNADLHPADDGSSSSISVAERTGIQAGQYLGITLNSGRVAIVQVSTGYTPTTGAGLVELETAWEGPPGSPTSLLTNDSFASGFVAYPGTGLGGVPIPNDGWFRGYEWESNWNISGGNLNRVDTEDPLNSGAVVAQSVIGDLQINGSYTVELEITSLTKGSFYLALGDWDYGLIQASDPDSELVSDEFNSTGVHTFTFTYTGEPSNPFIYVGDYLGLVGGFVRREAVGTISYITLAASPTTDYQDDYWANSGNDVVSLTELNGVDDFQPSFQPIAADDKLVITNNVDPIKVYDGTTIETLPGLPESGATTCIALGYHKNHLLLLGTTEGATAHPQRVRNSDTGNIEEWSAGNAGFEDLLDTEDHIVGGDELGPYFIIYKERSIHRQSYVGTADRLFLRESMVSGEGAVSADSIVNLGEYHVFFGNSNIYRYRGAKAIEPIADAVLPMVFGREGDLNASFKSRVFTLYVEELDELWFFYPSRDSEYPNRTLKLSSGEMGWFYRKFADSMGGFGFFLTVVAKDWDELEGDWAAQNYHWNSRAVLDNAPTTHLCGVGDNQVFEYDYVAGSDDGDAIAFFHDTKDFMDPGYFMRVDGVTLYARGSNITVSYSIDGGDSYTELGTFTSIEMQTHDMFGQFACEKFRIRIEGQGSGYELAWMKIMYKRESPW